MKRTILRTAMLAAFPGLLSCGPAGFLMYRGTDVRDGYDDLRVEGDRANDVVRLSSAWQHFEIPLPYAEDWEVYDSGKGTISATSTNLRIMVRVYRTDYPLRRDDREAELRETQLRVALAFHPEDIDQISLKKRNSETLLEYVDKSTTPRWFAVCGNRRPNEPDWTYLVTIKVKERPEPAMSALLERVRDIIAKDFRTLP